MEEETGDDKDARPDLQLRAHMCLTALRLMVAFRTCYFIGERQPNRQSDVEKERAQQNDLKGFDDIIGAHEITKVIIPNASVVAQDA